MEWEVFFLSFSALVLPGPLDGVQTPGRGLAPALSAASLCSDHIPSPPPTLSSPFLSPSLSLCLSPLFSTVLHSCSNFTHSPGLSIALTPGASPTVPSTTRSGSFLWGGYQCIRPLPRQQQGSYLAIACPRCSSQPSSGLSTCEAFQKCVFRRRFVSHSAPSI